MRRLAIFAAMLGLAGTALAQGFSIVRPKDGSVVREVVQVRIPKGAVPEGHYVGFWINGKFLEAVGLDAADVSGNDYVYKLDTKGRKFPDGKLSITAKLYADFENGPKEMNSSSVDVTLDNSNSIKIPAGGLKLRYAFTPGTQLVYNVEAKVTEASITEIQKQLGGRASEEMIDTQKLRFLVAVDNAYKTTTGTDGLLRVQLLPPKGKEYAYVDLNNSGTPVKYSIDQMWPIYMRVSDAGRELFGSLPGYFGFENSDTGAVSDGLLIPFALPQLPAKGLKPGDTFPGSFQQVVPNLMTDPALNIFAGKVTTGLPARGILEAVEWENGIPCAKIRNTIEVAQGEAKVTLDSTYWFALDRKCIVKYILNQTIETKVSSGQAGGAGAAATGGRGGGGNVMGPSRGGGRGGGMMGPPGGGDGGDFSMQRGGRGGRGGAGLAPPPPSQGGSRGGSPMAGPGGPAGPAGSGAAGGRGAGGGGGRGSNTEYIRVRQQFMITLEK
ncbi:MAG: hypothetical protein K1X67_12465 [Fimbriimonadaceae bacterium]|nr:hypothetical protein [Fimbriimonadaceae bacterium]